MTKFRDGFMMKSPLAAHKKLEKQLEILKNDPELAVKKGLSTEGQGGKDFEAISKLEQKIKKAKAEHAADGPIKMATASYRRTPMDTETYYGGEIDVPDITSVGTLAGGAIDSLESGGKDGENGKVLKTL